MKIADVEIYQYALDLSQPFVSHAHSFKKREGLIARLILPDGRSGVGDVAPLPGVSQENLKKALFQLKELRPFLFESDLPEDWAALRRMFAQEYFQLLCPSVAFGLQTAIIHLLSIVQAQHPAAIFQGAKENISVAGLVQGSPEEVAIQVKSLLKRKCQTFKLKVGDRNIPLDVKRFYALHDLLEPQHKIRLDVNRVWQLSEAVTFCKNIPRDRVEFIEEPAKNSDDLRAFVAQTGFDVALDETLWNLPQEESELLSSAKCLVIKPTMIGGILKSLDWIDYAQQNRKSCVISSSFESGVGTRLLAQLAALTTSDAGLGPSDWFANDLLGLLWEKDDYAIRLKDTAFGWPDLNQSLLSLVKI
ncbi:MAG: o-succinylbenzoate synthase [Candidatus Omnitrophica bacterium]|nr:o-succinylbenzoate synthase [Candidatus Omnitrophota bacterium]